ncbi:MAG TPA: hypothetical protein VMH40_12795 [Myxococcaceae bacterium]|nr:hypothetical protein [Myxococcaceae bacterium]
MRRLCLSLLVVAGCAHAPVESAAPSWTLLRATEGSDEIQLRSDVHMRRATVTAEKVHGPDLELRRAEGKLDGTTYYRRPVELQLRGESIVGQVGAEDWDLRVSPDGSETRVTGVIAGNPSTFWMSPARVRGALGTCTFDLVWSTGLYAGSRTCGLTSDNIALQVPAALSSWSSPEVAALLGILAQRE